MEDYDDPVYINVERIQESIDSGEIVLPKGLNGEERRIWVRKYLHLNKEQDLVLKQLRTAFLCFECDGFGCVFCDDRGSFNDEV